MLRGSSAEHFVEVYDEPDHERRLENDYVYAYRVILPPDKTTLWHRHREDTVYFSLADARAKEEFPAKDAVVTKVPCGAAISRPHRSEPLIHKVTNAGAATFHMIGAEARKRPPRECSRPIDAPGYTLALETSRFRVYRIACADAAPLLSHDRYGLLVALSACDLELGGGGATRRLQGGDVHWIDAANNAIFAAGFAGFFAQWC